MLKARQYTGTVLAFLAIQGFIPAKAQVPPTGQPVSMQKVYNGKTLLSPELSKQAKHLSEPDGLYQKIRENRANDLNLRKDNSMEMGTNSGGGGEGFASHYFSVSLRALNAIKIVCKGLENAVRECTYLAPLELSATSMKVVPRSRDTVVGNDGFPRDGGNDGVETVFIDVDRWSDKQNESNPNKTMQARVKQIQLALHEPLVLAGVETNDQYNVSDAFVELLVNYNFDLNRLVGAPSVLQNPEIKYLLKYFEGSSKIGSVRLEVLYEAAEADGVQKASEEGYFECKKARTWTSTPFFNGGTEAHVQLKCQKPAQK